MSSQDEPPPIGPLISSLHFDGSPENSGVRRALRVYRHLSPKVTKNFVSISPFVFENSRCSDSNRKKKGLLPFSEKNLKKFHPHSGAPLQWNVVKIWFSLITVLRSVMLSERKITYFMQLGLLQGTEICSVKTDLLELLRVKGIQDTGFVEMVVTGLQPTL